MIDKLIPSVTVITILLIVLGFSSLCFNAKKEENLLKMGFHREYVKNGGYATLEWRKSNCNCSGGGNETEIPAP